jgi:hypothetical protein
MEAGEPIAQPITKSLKAVRRIIGCNLGATNIYGDAR